MVFPCVRLTGSWSPTKVMSNDKGGSFERSNSSILRTKGKSGAIGTGQTSLTYLRTASRFSNVPAACLATPSICTSKKWPGYSDPCDFVTLTLFRRTSATSDSVAVWLDKPLPLQVTRVTGSSPQARVRNVTLSAKARPANRPIPLKPLSLPRCLLLRPIGINSCRASLYDRPGPLSRILTRRPDGSMAISTFPCSETPVPATASAEF